MGSKQELDEISKLCEELQLYEDDGLVVCMGKEEYSKRLEKMNLFLVGKVLGNWVANRERLERMLRGVWKICNSF